MNLNKCILKLLNLPVALRIRFYPKYNRMFFKLKNVKYGRNFNILGKVYVIGSGKIRIGDNFMMTSGDCVNPIARNIRGCFYTEPNAEIVIGDNVGMSSTSMWVSTKLTIGNNVNIGGNSLLIDTDSHPVDYKLRRGEGGLEEIRKAVCKAPIIIEDDVWIGANCIVLKGVTIGARSIIGAGSVVTKSIPSDCIAAGNPAKVVRRIFVQNSW